MSSIQVSRLLREGMSGVRHLLGLGASLLGIPVAGPAELPGGAAGTGLGAGGSR